MVGLTPGWLYLSHFSSHLKLSNTRLCHKQKIDFSLVEPIQKVLKITNKLRIKNYKYKQTCLQWLPLGNPRFVADRWSLFRSSWMQNCKKKPRNVVATNSLSLNSIWFYLKNFSIIFQQVTALCVIPMTWQFWILIVGLITGGGLLFYVLARIGEKLIEKNELADKAENFSEKNIQNLQGYDSKITISDMEWKFRSQFVVSFWCD